MKHQKNTRRIAVCLVCALVAAVLLPISALASGYCSYVNPANNVVCGRQTSREVVSLSPVYTATHYYYNEELGCTARCDYTYCYITEADVCASGHVTNSNTYYHEHYDHGCQNAGR